MDVDNGQDGLTSQSDNQSQETVTEPSNLTTRQEAQAIAELDKMERFKYQGQEWTKKDLENAILRQKDYTKKTQELSEGRKAYESEKKYHAALYYDLDTIRSNPTKENINEFIRVYPQSFHSHLQKVLETLQTQNNQQGSQNQQSQTQRPQYDVDLMSRLTKLEKATHDQEVAKNTTNINTIIGEMSKKYPDAIPKLAIAEIFDKYNETGKEPSKEDWDEAFKAVNDQLDKHYKSRYGSLVKKQTQANDKGRGDAPGGGQVGKAPPKFKRIEDIGKFAAADLAGSKGR